jgi:hypothetical protein
MTSSKIFYSIQITQTRNDFMSSTPKRQGEVQIIIFSYLIVVEGLQLSLMMRLLVLLACKPSDCASNGFWELTIK